MASTITISTPTQAAAAVPWTLGFAPSESLVVLHCDRGPTARVDLPEVSDRVECAEAVEVLEEPYQRYPGRVVVFGYSGQPTEALRPLLEALSVALSGSCEVVDVLHVEAHQVTRLATGERFPLTESDHDATAAPMVSDGHRMPSPSREDLANSLAPASPQACAEVREHLPQALEHLLGLLGDAESIEGEAVWMRTRLETFSNDHLPLRASEVARFSTALAANKTLRDALLTGLTRHSAGDAAEMLTDLARRAPEDHRSEVGTILAFTHWLRGNGASAWVALDWAQTEPGHRLAGLVEQMLREAVNPSAWDDVTSSGEAARPA